MPGPGPVELLVIAAIAAMFALPIVLVVALLRRRDARPPRPDPALDALRTRFADGDIDEAEYERLRRTLQRG